MNSAWAADVSTVPVYSHLFSLGPETSTAYSTQVHTHRQAHTHTHTHTHTQTGHALTVTFHPLVDEAVQQRAAVVAEGGAAVRVDLELVLASGVLGDTERDGKSVKY